MKTKAHQDLVDSIRENQKPEDTREFLREYRLKRGIVFDETEFEETELVAELNALGLNVKSAWDLIYAKKGYSEAFPILRKYLTKGYHIRVTEGIVRALTCKELKGIINKELLDLYYSTPRTDENSGLTWVIGNAFSVIITKEDIEPILQIVQDKSNGISRQMFVTALSKFKLEKIEDVFIDLLDDRDVTLHALGGVGKFKSQKAKAKIIKLTLLDEAVKKREIRVTAIRNYAKKALLKILKEEEKVALKLIQKKEKTTKE